MASTATAPKPRALTLGDVDRHGARKYRSLWNNAWRQFRKHHLAVAGLIMFGLILLCTMVGTVIYPKDKEYIDFMASSLRPFQTWDHPLGTDTWTPIPITTGSADLPTPARWSAGANNLGRWWSAASGR